ncbi:MAG: hypothetical protein AMXMBFR84_47640 [Candidatus Hydrogenedentota bacterium]
MRRKADRDLLTLAQSDQKTLMVQSDQKRQKRHAIRHMCHAYVDLEMATAAGGSSEWKVSKSRMKGRVLDLSSSGVSLFVQHALAIGQPFRLSIELYDGTKIEALAEARWTKTVEAKGGYAIGGQFTHVAPKDAKAIQRFLSELESTAGLGGQA